MAESGPFGGGPHDAGGEPGRGRPESSAAGQWLRDWRARLPEDDPGLPDEEARLVVEAVLEDLRGGQPDNLDRAGRAWGRAHRSVSEMVGRLSTFREALAASGVDDPLRMHRALDRVTAAATEEVLHRLEHASRTDALTGVGNRRAFDETLGAALSAAARQGHDVTVVAVDLDGLKRINDTEGHAAGDAALLSLVRSLYAALRDEDTVFRVGGDEFVILLPFTSVSAAELLMERIHAGGAPAFTWGAAGFPADASDAAALVEAADQDLYRRRQMRRVDRPAPVRRVVAPMRSLSGAPVLRWAWIPAAAVLVMSMVATLVTAGPEAFTAKNHHHGGSSPATTLPGGGGPAGGGPAGTGPVPVFAGGRGFGGVGNQSPGNAVTTGFTQPGQSPPGGTEPPTTTTTTAPSQPHTGGVLGTVGQLIAPVPVVGPVGDGLVTLVGAVLVGSPVPQPVTTVVAAPVTTSASPATTTAAPASGPVGGAAALLATVGNLLH